MKSAMQKFQDRYEIVTESGCWLWTGHIQHDGYGTFEMGGKTWRAHRASWVLHGNEIPPGKLVMHRCDVRCCVNLAHLFVGTNDENMADMVAKGRQAKGSRIKNAIFTEDQVRIIRADTRSQRIIGLDYGVLQTTIGNIKLHKTYAWVV